MSCLELITCALLYFHTTVCHKASLTEINVFKYFNQSQSCMFKTDLYCNWLKLERFVERQNFSCKGFPANCCMKVCAAATKKFSALGRNLAIVLNKIMVSNAM